MPRVAYLTAACMLASSGERRSDAFEHELQAVPLREACARYDIELIDQVWDDPALDPASYDAYVVGTPWDYMEKRAAFKTRLAQLAAVRPLHNPLAVLRWNLEKRYLAELEARGVAIVPTLWAERASAESILSAFDELASDELVVKPLVGAGAWRQARVRRGEPLPPASELPPDATMIQPYLASVATEGEISFVFFDGAFSHAALKLPAAGDYRVQSMYGAREVIYEPSSPELELARDVLEAVDTPLLYARVDMVRGEAAQGGSRPLLLMELELVEPYLYPEQGPQLGERFARALATRLQLPTS